MIKPALERVDDSGMFLPILVAASIVGAVLGAWSLNESLAYRLLVVGSLLAVYVLMAVPAYLL